MPSRLCKVCSTVPWADLYRQAASLDDASISWPVQISPDFHTTQGTCTICHVLYSSGLKPSPENNVVYVRSHYHCFIDTNQQSTFRSTSVVFEKTVSDDLKVVIATFNLKMTNEATRMTRIQSNDLTEVPASSLQSSTFGTIQSRVESRDEIRTRLVTADPPVQKMLDLPKSWLATCLHSHGTCNDSALPCVFLPTRLLRIGIQPEDPIRLVHITAGMKDPYTALSHCWGSKQTYTTTSDTLSSRLAGIAFCDLPRTFQDAVTVSRSLGLSYLWIDSLCIIQGEDGDWESESLRMKSVYSNATVVISASRSPSDTTGFLLPRTVGEIITVPSGDTVNNSTVDLQQVLSSLSPYQDAMISEPLQNRAWALQERYLATRTLFFTSHQMFWECKTVSLAEDGRRQFQPRYRVDQLVPFKGKDLNDSMSHAELQSHKPWYSMIQNYMSCNITYPSDRLPAVSGLAQFLSSETADVYLAGIWKRSLICGLMWRRYRWSSLTKQPKHIAPSWSWASVEGQIEFCMFAWFNDFRHGIEYYVSIESCQVETNGVPFGIARSGSINLSAPMFLVHIQKGPYGQSHYPELSDIRPGTFVQAQGTFHRIFDTMFGIQYGQQILFVSGSLDQSATVPESRELYIVFLAGEAAPSLSCAGERLPSNEGYFGLIVEKSSYGASAYSRVGVVHGKLMPATDGIDALSLFEAYRSWRKQDYLASVGQDQPRSLWFPIAFKEYEKQSIRLF